MSTIRYASWLLLLPVVLAALFNYPGLQQSLQQYLPGWKSASLPEVTLPQGKLIGKILDNDSYPHAVEGFLAVPYVLPPIGDLRFANPVPIGPSNQTFVADTFGPRYSLCMQQFLDHEDANCDEDVPADSSSPFRVAEQ